MEATGSKEQNRPCARLFFVRRSLGHKDSGQAPLRHILVDEYQDTNPIQEQLYLSLAQNSPHNIMVVGDDDQALYRFRGGSVECMVQFDKACQAELVTEPSKVQLNKNYRSHPAIVKYFNDYIESFDVMSQEGVRAPNKAPMTVASKINGDYPAVAWITAKKVGDLAGKIADLISDHLIGDGIIEDLSQCAILMQSTRESPRNAGKIIEALKSKSIPYYNPRSKSFMEAKSVQCLLASLIRVIDGREVFRTINYRDFQSTLGAWDETLSSVISDEGPFNRLVKYIQQSTKGLKTLCQDKPDEFLGVGLLDIVHRILAHPPFSTWIDEDPVARTRLSKLTRFFESYQSLNLDDVRSEEDGSGVSISFLRRFYHTFIAYLITSGINDEEDEEVVVPRGAVPIMTVHQAKGLEFPFVIMAQMGKKRLVTPGASHEVEKIYRPHRDQLYDRDKRGVEQLAWEDAIRFFYVAYSRPQYGLVMVGTKAHAKKHVAIPGREFDKFKRTIPALQ